MSLATNFTFGGGQRHDVSALRGFQTLLSSRANPGGVGLFGNIVNTLPDVVNVERGLYDVGLVKLRYTPQPEEKVERRTKTVTRIVRPKQTRRIIPAERELPTGPLFPGISPPRIDSFRYNNGDAKLEDLISRVNRAMLTSNTRVTFSAQVVQAGGYIITINNQHEDLNEYLLLSETFAAILGFKRRFFTQGKFAGEDVATEEAYSRTVKPTEFSIGFIKYPYKGSLIAIDQQFQSLAAYWKRSETNYKRFFTGLSARFLEHGFNVNFSFNAANKCKVDVSTPVKHKSDYITLPEALLKCLGFTHERFNTGSEESTTVFNEEEFAKLRVDDTLFFRLSYKNLYPIAMKEPQTMGVPDVLAELNAALASEKFLDYSIKFQYENGELFTNEIPRDYTIDLPYSVK
ncbi:unnamed protein product, partial [Allacma fusca]